MNSPLGLNAMCIPGIFQTANRTLTRPQAKLQNLIPAADPQMDLIMVVDAPTLWVTGNPPVPNLQPQQFSLTTTVMHELCHGLGFLGLCDVALGLGTYSAAGSLLPALNGVLHAMNPVVVLPNHFFPAQPASGIQVITPFANLFQYTNGQLQKGLPADDGIAFTSPPVSIQAPGLQLNGQHTLYTITTGAPFAPFTTCDHIVSPPQIHYLMSPSTQGMYLAAPDVAARELLRAIGWAI
jgi:hypothetical protein